MQPKARRWAVWFAVAIVIVLGSGFAVVDGLRGSQAYVVASGSMSPTLEVGDVVLVRNVPFSSIKPGEVIVFDVPSSGGGCTDLAVVHRVVGFASDGDLITQGDNRRTNPMTDEPVFWPYVTPSCVKGEVVLTVPYIGRVSTLFPSPYDYLVVAAALMVILVVGSLRERHERV